MPHIHTEEGQHDLTVSMYIVRTDFDQPKIMLHVHKKHGVWMQFGGHVELNENPWKAVEHELLEESGYDVSQLQLLQPPVRMRTLSGSAELHPQPFDVNTHKVKDGHFHIALEYAFVSDEVPSHDIGEDESDQIRLFTRDELLALPEDQIFESNRSSCLYVLDECLPEWERVSL